MFPRGKPSATWALGLPPPGLASQGSGGRENSQPGDGVYHSGGGVLGSRHLSHGLAALTLSICWGGRNGGGGGGNHRPAARAFGGSPWLPAGLCPISTSSEPHLGRGSRVIPRAGGGDSDQPEYQRCEAGMTSPRVCPLSEPCQATLPARSQAPPGRLRQQASASHSKGVPTRRAGSQPGLRPGTSLGTSSRLSWGQCCGLLEDPGTSLAPWGWGIWRSREGGLRLRSAVKKEGRLLLPRGQGA